MRELQREGVWVSAIKPKGDKIARTSAQTAMIEGGGALFPKHAT